ncbi:recombinase family protein [Aminobacter sp. MSH1]|uniref:recombinase family protein n=1 Tax=Aminobacter sp. MSH1 TaxID=374606 RepID=UPI000D350507|nr:recombinase family protein [Aminobacter sp. MSH1]
MVKAAPKSPKSPKASQTGLLLGYERVSTDDQNLDLQRDALMAAGCSEIYSEKQSRALKSTERPELRNLLRAIRPGDTLVVWKLDRLGGNLVDLITLSDDLSDRGIHFRSITENIDTSTATGRMFFQFVSMLAEFERNRLIERTRAGLAAARARGRKGGRPKALTAKQIREAKALLKDPEITVADVCKQMGVSRTTLYKYVGTVAPQRSTDKQQ